MKGYFYKHQLKSIEKSFLLIIFIFISLLLLLIYVKCPNYNKGYIFYSPLEGPLVMKPFVIFSIWDS